MMERCQNYERTHLRKKLCLSLAASTVLSLIHVKIHCMEFKNKKNAEMPACVK